MKYQFRPYATMQPTEVTLTGNVYEKGEHPIYTEHRIIEVVDEQGEMHYAFEDELKSDEVEEKEISYSEEDMVKFVSFVGKSYIKAKGFYYMKGDFEKKHKVSIHQILEQFKNK